MLNLISVRLVSICPFGATQPALTKELKMMIRIVSDSFIWVLILPLISAGIRYAQTLPDEAIMLLGRGNIGDIKYSPDGKFIAIATSIGIEIFDAESLSRQKFLQGHSGRVLSACFSPDGTKLASGSEDTTITIWDVATGNELATLWGHSKLVNSVSFSPDGTKLASGSLDRAIKIWDVEENIEIATLSGHRYRVNSLCFSPDGTMLASSGPGGIKLWDITKYDEIATIEGHKGDSMGVYRVIFSPDGTKLVSSAYDIKVWDVEKCVEIASFPEAKEGRLPITSISFSPDGSKLADSTIRLWDPINGIELAKLTEQAAGVVSFSPDGDRLISGSSYDGTIRVWNVSKSIEIASLSGYTDQVSYVGFSADGSKLASSGFHVGLTVWDMATGNELMRIPGWVRAVSFSPDGTKIAGQNQDKKVSIWDAANSTELSVLEHVYWVNSTCFSPDGTKLVSGGEELKFWDIEKDAEIISSKDFARVVSFSPDGKRFAAAKSKSVTNIPYNIIEFWDVVRCIKISTLRTHRSGDTRITSFSFSPDGKKVILGSEYGTISRNNADRGGELSLWDIEKGVVRMLYESPFIEPTPGSKRNNILSVAFSPDGKMIAIALRDGTVKLREVSSGAEITTFCGHVDEVMSVAFSFDGLKLASGSKDGTILIWDVSKYAEVKPDADIQGWEREEPIIDAEAYEKEQGETLEALQREWEPWFAEGIREYRPYGFFRSVKTDEDVQNRAKELAAKYAQQGRPVLTGRRAYLELVYAEPTNIYYFDAECIGGAGSYVSIIKELAKITDGVFQPTEISDVVDWENKRMEVSFAHKGKKYTFDLNFYKDWFDPSLIPKLNQAIKGADKQFYLYKYRLYIQSAFVVFISPEQKSRLEEEKGWEFTYTTQDSNNLSDEGSD